MTKLLITIVSSPGSNVVTSLSVTATGLNKAVVQDTAMLSCSFAASPEEVTIRWKVMGDSYDIAVLFDCTNSSVHSCRPTISNSEKYSLSAVSDSLEYSFSLEIHNITIEDDGYYECIVEAQGDSGRSSVYVSVLSKTLIS